MGQYEIIDRLCGVTTELSDLVKKQAEIIAQCDIPDELNEELDAMREKADKDLDVIEYKLRART